MDGDDRQFLLTVAWLFARHGQNARARVICEALVEDDPRDGVSAAALAEQMLADREPEAALSVVRGARFPRELERAEALLETRALHELGKRREAEKRWARYVAASKGKARSWVG
ncbi:MAG: hypothetical protein MJ138_04550 [Kiritimatiellae bacterium]|nr:hypothetical protein [Kiritimatiellia bacterium]